VCPTSIATTESATLSTALYVHVNDRLKTPLRILSTSRPRTCTTQRRNRADSVFELDAGHHPFLSRPAAVRDLLLSL
jgi:hypothetical protein